MHFWDFFVLALVALAAGGAARFWHKRKKGGCGGSCSSCGADCPYRKEER